MMTLSDVGFGCGSPSFCQVAVRSWSKEHPVCPNLQVYNCVSTTRDCLIPRRGWTASQIPSTPEAAELASLVLNLMCVDPAMLSIDPAMSWVRGIVFPLHGGLDGGNSEKPSCENCGQKVLCVLAGVLKMWGWGWGGPGREYRWWNNLKLSPGVRF